MSKSKKNRTELVDHNIDTTINSPYTNSTYRVANSGLNKDGFSRATDIVRDECLSVPNQEDLHLYTTEKQISSRDFYSERDELTRICSAMLSSTQLLNSRGDVVKNVPNTLKSKFIKARDKDLKHFPLDSYVHATKSRASASGIIIPLLKAIDEGTAWSVDFVLDTLKDSTLICPNLSLHDNVNNIRACCMNVKGLENIETLADQLLEQLKPELEIWYTYATTSVKNNIRVARGIINGDGSDAEQYRRRYNKLIEEEGSRYD